MRRGTVVGPFDKCRLVVVETRILTYYYYSNATRFFLVAIVVVTSVVVVGVGRIMVP